MNKENYKLLPKIEVSFQDQFSGGKNEITNTVKYVIDELSDMNIKPEIGTKVLLWEEDFDADNKKYYLCNIGEIVELPESKIKEYSNTEVSTEELARLNNKTVMIKIDRGAHFDLQDFE